MKEILQAPTQNEKLGRMVYGILTETCRAPSTTAAMFAAWWANDGGSEFRFRGCLGFGGKFWRSNGRWYVNYYPEDKMDTRDAAVTKANSELESLRRMAVLSRDAAEAISESIVDDISGRSGLHQAWEEIDESVRKQIEASWVTSAQNSILDHCYTPPE